MDRRRMKSLEHWYRVRKDHPELHRSLVSITNQLESCKWQLPDIWAVSSPEESSRAVKILHLVVVRDSSRCEWISYIPEALSGFEYPMELRPLRLECNLHGTGLHICYSRNVNIPTSLDLRHLILEMNREISSTGSLDSSATGVYSSGSGMTWILDSGPIVLTLFTKGFLESRPMATVQSCPGSNCNSPRYL